MIATVSRSSAALASSRVTLAIAIDSAYIVGHGSDGQITKGVFLMDNMVRNHSTGEGTLQLHTFCNAGDLIGFYTLPVNAAG